MSDRTYSKDGLIIAIPVEFHQRYDNNLDFISQTTWIKGKRTTIQETGQIVNIQTKATQNSHLIRKKVSIEHTSFGQILVVQFCQQVFDELVRFKIKEMDSKNKALKNNCSFVRNPSKQIQKRYRAIIDLVHQFVSMNEVEQQENLVLNLEKIPRRNVDTTSIINRDHHRKFCSYLPGARLINVYYTLL